MALFALVSKNPYMGTRASLLKGSRRGRIVGHRNDDVADIGGLGVTAGLVAEEVWFAVRPILFWKPPPYLLRRGRFILTARLQNP
jgi:hypothetical protein